MADITRNRHICTEYGYGHSDEECRCNCHCRFYIDDVELLNALCERLRCSPGNRQELAAVLSQDSTFITELLGQNASFMDMVMEEFETRQRKKIGQLAEGLIAPGLKSGDE